MKREIPLHAGLKCGVATGAQGRVSITFTGRLGGSIGGSVLTSREALLIAAALIEAVDPAAISPPGKP